MPCKIRVQHTWLDLVNLHVHRKTLVVTAKPTLIHIRCIAYLT